MSSETITIRKRGIAVIIALLFAVIGIFTSFFQVLSRIKIVLVIQRRDKFILIGRFLPDTGQCSKPKRFGNIPFDTENIVYFPIRFILKAIQCCIKQGIQYSSRIHRTTRSAPICPAIDLLDQLSVPICFRVVRIHTDIFRKTSVGRLCRLYFIER